MADQRVLPWPTTESYWLRNAPWQGESQTPLPEKADVVIIGGGITGFSTAYWLRQLRPELKIVVIEARGVSSGATGRNGMVWCLVFGGLCWPNLNDAFRKTVAHIGLPSAKKLLEFEHLTLRAIKNFVSRHCDTDGGTFDPQLHIMPRGGLLLFTTEEQLREGYADYEALVKAGVGDNVIRLSREQVGEMTGSDKFLGGLQGKMVAIVWAARLVFALAREVIRPTETKGPMAEIHTFTRAQSVVRDPATGYLSITTSRGRITAAHVVHATNAWAWTLLPAFRARIVPVRNQVIFVRPPRENSHLWDFVISANDGYEYMSQRVSGDVILGGMRNIVEGREEGKPDDSTLNPKISQSLRRYLPEKFKAFRAEGEEVHAEMEWCGVMGFAHDRLPYVGSLENVLNKEEGKGQWIAAGFTGHGELYSFTPRLVSQKSLELLCMTRTFLSGRAIAEMIAGIPVSDWFPEEFQPDHHRRELCYKQDSQVSAKL
ncbi:FAD dependent oxidoreductase-domain-containing protein [Endogone sp. FLAS-F59071]|nr:FAD dependent oxidoreductase-domain-containing protein [Endogone sp. FLAS-F59071]|eukprot:RUS20153.1 FAD dependent oxidoreductase-domain-containing protein [Endogone sp. FLAS-F59071]